MLVTKLLTLKKFFISHQLQQTIFYALGIVITKLIGFLLLPYLTRVLTPADYGKLEIFVSIADFSTILLGLGLVDTLFRYTGNKTMALKKRIFHSLYATSAMASLIILIVVITLILVFRNSIPLDIDALIIISIAISLSGIIHLPLAWLRIINKAAAYTYILIAKTVLQVITIVILIECVDNLGWRAILISTLVTDLVLAMFLYIKYIEYFKLRKLLRRIRPTLLYSIPLVFASLANAMLGNVDKFFLVAYVDEAQIGLYGVAMKFGFIMGLANEVLMMWWLPKRFNLHHRPRRYGFYVSLGMTYILLVGSALLFICPVLMRLITPEEYHAAADFIPLIIACFVVFGLTTLSNSGAYGDKNTFIPLIINTLAAILVIVLYTYLIPLYSVMGAIWATLIAHLFRLVAYYAVRVKKHKIRLRPLAIIPSLVLFLAILINQLFPVL